MPSRSSRSPPFPRRPRCFPATAFPRGRSGRCGIGRTTSRATRRSCGSTWRRRRSPGVATVTFESLRASLTDLSLDAARPAHRQGRARRQGARVHARPEGLPSQHRARRARRARPRRDREDRVRGQPARRDVLLPEVGGARSRRPGTTARAASTTRWLPIYNDTNDRFAVEFVVTVPTRAHGRGQRRAGSAARERGRHAHLPLGRGEADPELPRDGRRRQFRPRAAAPTRRSVRRPCRSRSGAGPGSRRRRSTRSATRRRWSSSSPSGWATRTRGSSTTRCSCATSPSARWRRRR